MSAFGILTTTAMPTCLPADYNPSGRKKTDLLSAADSPQKEVESDFDEIHSQSLSAPNGANFDASSTSVSSVIHFMNNLVGKPSNNKTEAETPKAVVPEAWTIGQTKKLFDTFRGVHPLLSGDWTLKSQLDGDKRNEIITLFEKANESITDIEVILKEKLDKAAAEGKTDKTKFNSDMFSSEELKKLDFLPELLATIQQKVDGLYKQGDTLDKRTLWTMAAGCASLVSMITGIVLAGLGVVTLVPGICAALITVGTLIASAVFYLEDKANEAEAKDWAQDIKGLTDLSNELKKLEDSEMFSHIAAVKESAQTSQQSIDELSKRFDKFVEVVTPAVQTLMGRKGSADSTGSNDSGIGIYGSPPAASSMPRAKLMQEFKTILKTCAEKIADEKLLEKNKIIEIFTWLTTAEIKEIEDVPVALSAELSSGKYSELAGREKELLGVLAGNGIMKYWRLLQDIKNQYKAEQYENINGKINEKINNAIDSSSKQHSFA